MSCIICATTAALKCNHCEQPICSELCFVSHVTIPCLKNTRIGRVVVTPSGFVMVKVQQLDEDELFTIAKEYVKERKLPWNIRKPHSWTDYKAGPHITLDKNMSKYNGETVEVEIGSIFHFTSESNWVAIHVKLPSKLTCQYGCHISIGQQRL